MSFADFKEKLHRAVIDIKLLQAKTSEGREKSTEQKNEKESERGRKGILEMVSNGKSLGMTYEQAKDRGQRFNVLQQNPLNPPNRKIFLKTIRSKRMGC